MYWYNGKSVVYFWEFYFLRQVVGLCMHGHICIYLLDKSGTLQYGDTFALKSGVKL